MVDVVDLDDVDDDLVVEVEVEVEVLADHGASSMVMMDRSV